MIKKTEMPNRTCLGADNISKSFESRKVFSDINFELEAGEGLIITGANGSGKSTLVKILCGLLSPTSGKVSLLTDGREIPADRRYLNYGLVSPEMKLYEELTAEENISFFGKLHGLFLGSADISRILDKFGLRGRGDDLLRSFSSGMKQRMKYIIATLHEPAVLFLDEPSSNLDMAGMELVDEICAKQRQDDILIVATNEKRDMKYGGMFIELSGDSLGYTN
ncbi:MAG: ATP-binding cassette domain-containing protein [candidate division Zixibacteria bacterium]|nr:ATP-binding cassette domain-containing protein [candidate division Zixibacteria bacterium]